MMCPNSARRLSLALTVFAFVGCGGGARHVPTTNSAQKSLEAALTAWKDGQPVGQVSGANPTVQAEDGEWRAKKKLTAFEVVGEEPNRPADAPRRFKAKLTFDKAPIDAVFVVFGNDPVFVYRDKDYEIHFSKM